MGQDTANEDSVEAAAQRVVELEAELEVSGEAMTADAELAFIRSALHEWVDSVVGAVASPGVGRVTLIHANGSQSKIASPELPYRLSKPVRFG
jgi:hypothetical protein